MSQIRVTMPVAATLSALRHHFPKVRKLLKREGEVVLTESGRACYRLIPYTPPRKKAAPRVDYCARLTEHQPGPLTAVKARQLRAENRGNRSPDPLGPRISLRWPAPWNGARGSSSPLISASASWPGPRD